MFSATESTRLLEQDQQILRSLRGTVTAALSICLDSIHALPQSPRSLVSRPSGFPVYQFPGLPISHFPHPLCYHQTHTPGDSFYAYPPLDAERPAALLW